MFRAAALLAIAALGAGSAVADPVATEKADYAVRTNEVVVRFHSDVDPEVPVIVRPLTMAQRALRDVPYQVLYRFTNLSDAPQRIKAIHQIAPDYAEASFRKLACFCFEEQILAPHETREMPVVFTIAPDLAMETDSIDLTYVTFASAQKNAGTASVTFAPAAPAKR